MILYKGDVLSEILKLTWEDKIKLFENNHELLTIIDDSGWYLGVDELFERDVRISDGTGKYFFKLKSGDPRVDPAHSWEKMPDELTPYWGTVKQPNQKCFIVTVQSSVCYDYHKIWATSAAEAKKIINEGDSDPYDSDGESTNEIISIKEAR